MTKLLSTPLWIGFLIGLGLAALSLPTKAGEHSVHVKMKQFGQEVCGTLTVNWENPPASDCP